MHRLLLSTRRNGTGIHTGRISLSKNPNQVFFVDKNHPPNGIDKALGLIKENSSSNVELKIIAIAPDCSTGTKINDLPFSLEFIGKCLLRSLNRQEHDTLRGDAYKVFDVILMFCRMYRGMKMTRQHLSSMGFNELWTLPYCKNGVWEEEIKKQLENCIKNKGNLKELIRLMENRKKEEGDEVGEAEFRERLESEWGKVKEGEGDGGEEEELWDSDEDEDGSEKSD